MPERRSSSLIAILLAAAVFLAAAALSFAPRESHDLWWHLYTGRFILDAGWPPAVNTFSYTAPDFLWVTHEWLTEVILYLLYSHVGPAALVALKPLFVGGAFALTFYTAWRESGSPWCAAVAAVAGAYAARFTFDIRPQIITYLFLAVCLAAIYHYRRHGGPLIYALVPLIWVWANLHSGFIVGLMLLAIAAATTPQRARGFLGAFALGLGVSFLTPNTWRGVWFPIDMSRYALMLDNLTEWFSPNFHEHWTWGFEALLLATIAAIALSGRRLVAFELVLLVLFTHSALRHQRHIALFSLLLAPTFARHLAIAASRLRDRLPDLTRFELPAAACAVAVGLVLLLRPLPTAGDAKAPPRPKGSLRVTTYQDTFPEDAARFLKRQPPLRVYNKYIWGGYLIWRLYPHQKVFIDGRCDAYPPKVFRDYLAVERLRWGWRGILNEYRVQAVVYPRGSPLCNELSRDPEWRLAFDDGRLAQVFVRSHLATAP